MRDDLVRVEQVLRPVVSRESDRRRSRCWRRRRARAPAPDRRPPGGRPRSGGGPPRARAAAGPAPPGRPAPAGSPGRADARRARVISGTELAAKPSTGAAASTDIGLSRTRAGSSGAERQPGRERQRGQREQRRGCAGRAEQRLERHDQSPARGGGGRSPTRRAILRVSGSMGRRATSRRRGPRRHCAGRLPFPRQGGNGLRAVPQGGGGEAGQALRRAASLRGSRCASPTASSSEACSSASTPSPAVGSPTSRAEPGVPRGWLDDRAWCRPGPAHRSRSPTPAAARGVASACRGAPG